VLGWLAEISSLRLIMAVVVVLAAGVAALAASVELARRAEGAMPASVPEAELDPIG
jgi:hypothetical protein